MELNMETILILGTLLAVMIKFGWNFPATVVSLFLGHPVIACLVFMIEGFVKLVRKA